MKVVLTIIGVILVLLLFGTMLGGITDARTDERTDTFVAVVTGVGETDADVELVAELYDEDILNVVSITSDNALDGPLPDAYVAVGNTLTVRGLAASDTRTITVEYRYDALTGDAAPAGTFMSLIPLFIGIAIILIIVAAMVAAFRNR